jgi:hypothetical protein
MDSSKKTNDSDLAFPLKFGLSLRIFNSWEFPTTYNNRIENSTNKRNIIFGVRRLHD